MFLGLSGGTEALAGLVLWVVAIALMSGYLPVRGAARTWGTALAFIFGGAMIADAFGWVKLG